MTDRATAPLQQPARAGNAPAVPTSTTTDTGATPMAKDDGLTVPQGGPSTATPTATPAATPPARMDGRAEAAASPASGTAASDMPAGADPSPPPVAGDGAPSGTLAPFGNIAPAAPPPDLQSRLDAAAKIADPHQRKLVEANLRLLTQRELTAFTDQQRAAKAQAKGIIDQGGDLGSIPAKVLLQIDQSGRQALHDYVAAHGNPRTDAVTYYALKNQALDDPAAFQGVDLGDHMARLDAKDYGELTQLQTSLRNGQPPADLPLQQVYKSNTDRMLQQLGLPSGPAIAAPANDAAQVPQRQDTTTPPIDPQSLQMATQLRRDVDQALAAHQVVQGRPATPAEQQQFLDQAVISRYGTRYRTSLTAPGIDRSLRRQDLQRPAADHLPKTSPEVPASEPQPNVVQPPDTSVEPTGRSQGGGRITFLEAYDHYKDGSGSPMRLSIDQLNLSAIRPDEFEGFNSAVSAGRDTNIDLRQPFSMSRSSINDYLLLGNATLRLQGRLTFDKNGDWTLNGTYKVFDDTYDFNRSTHRWFGGEWLTSIGRGTNGKPFPIEIHGAQPVTATSKQDDSPTIYVGP